MAAVLLVDDERTIRGGLKSLLTVEGYAVDTAKDGEEALAKFKNSAYDLVMLDIMMPKMNGYKACQEIRKLNESVPILFLTAKDSESDEVRGLDMGADDFISKTAAEGVVLARVRRALTRTATLLDSDAAVCADMMRFGSSNVNFQTGEIRRADGSTEMMTVTESDLLRLLVVGSGRVIKSDELIEALRGKGFSCEDNMLYVHVSNLRRKLGAGGSCIVNERHAGYRLLQ